MRSCSKRKSKSEADTSKQSLQRGSVMEACCVLDCRFFSSAAGYVCRLRGVWINIWRSRTNAAFWATDWETAMERKKLTHSTGCHGCNEPMENNTLTDDVFSAHCKSFWWKKCITEPAPPVITLLFPVMELFWILKFHFYHYIAFTDPINRSWLILLVQHCK